MKAFKIYIETAFAINLDMTHPIQDISGCKKN